MPRVSRNNWKEWPYISYDGNKYIIIHASPEYFIINKYIIIHASLEYFIIILIDSYIRVFGNSLFHQSKAQLNFPSFRCMQLIPDLIGSWINVLVLMECSYFYNGILTIQHIVCTPSNEYGWIPKWDYIWIFHPVYIVNAIACNWTKSI